MIKRIAALLILVLLPVFAAAEEAPAEVPMVYPVGSFSGEFNPFFANDLDDRELVDRTTARLIAFDENGDPVLTGIAGAPDAYGAEGEMIYGMSDVQIVENADGSVDYHITMREDVVFSDGVPADIDDVIFGIYVLCDPTYHGFSALRYQPIEGMDAYYNDRAPLATLMMNAGRDNTDFSCWTAETQEAFWADVDIAGEKLAAHLVEHVMENYLTDDFAATIGCSVADILADEDLQLKFAMHMWGYGDAWAEGVTPADFWQAMLAAHDGNAALAAATEAPDAGIYDYIDDYDAKYGAVVALGEPVNRISGIERTGDYSMTVHFSRQSDLALYELAVPVVPLHHYGDEALYDYEGGSFGFVKGDLAPVQAKNDIVSCGEYIFAGYADGVAVLNANPDYFGAPAEFETLWLQEE